MWTLCDTYLTQYTPVPEIFMLFLCVSILLVHVTRHKRMDSLSAGLPADIAVEIDGIERL